MTGEGAHNGDLFQGFSSDWKLISNFMMEFKNNLQCELFLGKYFSSSFVSLKLSLQIMLHGDIKT